MIREKLPNRRASEQFDFVHDDQKCMATVGRYPDGRIGEIFLSVGRKADAHIDVNARDMAIGASIAIQHGADIETIRHALTRNSRGEPSSALGTLLDLLAVQPPPVEKSEKVETPTETQ